MFGGELERNRAFPSALSFTVLARQRGLIMIDILIGAVIGLIVLGAAIKVYVDILNANNTSLKSSKLNQEVNAIALLIGRDVRRAGYWAAIPNKDDLTKNPFTNDINDLAVSNKTGQAAESCVLYSYDLNKDKLVGVGNNGVAPTAPLDGIEYNSVNLEQFGFRLNGGNLEMRQGLALGDTDVTCDNGSWVTVNSDAVNISEFKITPNFTCYSVNRLYKDPLDPTPLCQPAIQDVGQVVRGLLIHVKANLKNSRGDEKSVDAMVKIRNDKYIALVQ